MSINDEAMQDIEQDGGDVQTVVVQTELNKHMQEVKPLPEGSQDFMNTVAKAATAQVAFKDVHEKTNKLMDLQDMAQEIAHAGAISKSDAQSVGTSFENFSSVISLNEFTRIPSKTNFVFTVGFMDRSIKVAQEGLRSKFESFMNEPLNDVKCMLDRIEDEHLPALVKEYSCLSAMAVKLLPQIQQNKNLIVPSGESFVDMRTIALQELDLQTIAGQTGFDILKLRAALENFKQLWGEYGIFRSMLVGVLEGKSVQEIKSSGAMVSSIGKMASIVDLCKILASPYLLEVLHTLYDWCEDSADKVEDLVDSGKAVMMDGVASQKFLVENSGAIGGMLGSAHSLSEAVATLIQMAPSFEVLLEDFARF